MPPTTNETAASLDRLIWVDPERMSGAPCFYGTRVPVEHLFDYLQAGQTVDDFLDGFDGITREQAAAVVRLAGESLLTGLRHAA